jgi:hypothetical protein
MAKDVYHNIVKTALVKEGWNITHDPMHIDLEETYVEIDLAAEIAFAANRGDEKIAVEVKSFLSKSIISDFHTAIGQFLDYRDALDDTEPERDLYLAIPNEIFQNTVFQGKFIQRRLKRENVHLITFDIENEIIIQWIKQ